MTAEFTEGVRETLEQFHISGMYDGDPVDDISTLLDEIDRLNVEVAGTREASTRTHVAWNKAEDIVEEVEEVLSPDWIRGRVLPRVVGAGDAARVTAIQKIMKRRT